MFICALHIEHKYVRFRKIEIITVRFIMSTRHVLIANNSLQRCVIILKEEWPERRRQWEIQLNYRKRDHKGMFQYKICCIDFYFSKYQYFSILSENPLIMTFDRRHNIKADIRVGGIQEYFLSLVISRVCFAHDSLEFQFIVLLYIYVCQQTIHCKTVQLNGPGSQGTQYQNVVIRELVCMMITLL